GLELRAHDVDDDRMGLPEPPAPTDSLVRALVAVARTDEDLVMAVLPVASEPEDRGLADQDLHLAREPRLVSRDLHLVVVRALDAHAPLAQCLGDRVLLIVELAPDHALSTRLDELHRLGDARRDRAAASR